MEPPFTSQEIIYYVAVWSVSSIAAFSQTLQDANYHGIRHSVSVAMVAGFFGFATIAIVDGNLADRAGDEFTYLGVAAIIGLSASDHDKLLRRLREYLIKKFLPLDMQDDDEKTS